MRTALARKPKLMTAEEFYDFVLLPENSTRWFELVRGEVIELPRPMLPHGVVCVTIGSLLLNHARSRRKGFVTVNDTGVLLERHPDTIRGPDIAYLEGVKSFTELPKKWAAFPPRLAVEVLSPNDRAGQINRKIQDYLNNGVEIVWLVDPEERSVTVYTPDTGPRTVAEEGELTGGNVLPSFRCKVADFFFMPEEESPPKPRARPTRRRKKRGG